PFVQMIRDNLELHGESALETGCPFDQVKVLNENIEYVLASLDMDKIDIRMSSAPGVPQSVFEMAFPGRPVIMYASTCPGLDVTFRNVDVCSGLFEFTAPVVNNDTALVLSRRLKRLNRSIKPRSSISVWRYVDPVAGDRKMISLSNPKQNNVVIPESAIFHVDMEAAVVKVFIDGSLFDIGKTLIYSTS
ncbi:hypothetical protein AB6A40_006851, partial [Gnathostoma spinigerum]